VSTPILSIVIPVRNGGEYLREAINSAIKATVGIESFEILVSDNYSTDDTAEIIESYDSNIVRRIVPPAALSIGGNWTYVSTSATGEFIKFLGADDLLYGNIDQEISLLRKFPSCVALIARRDIIDSRGRVKIRSRGISNETQVRSGEEVLARTWASGTNLIGDPTAILFRRQSFQKALPWEDDPYPFVIDLNYYVKCFSNEKVLLTYQTVSAFRIHGGSVTGRTFLGQAKQFIGLYELKWESFYDTGGRLRLVNKIRVYSMAYVKQFAKILFMKIYMRK